MKKIIALVGCFSFLIISCKGPKNVYYSANNPYNLTIWIQLNNTVYTINHLLHKNPDIDFNSENTLQIWLENNSSETIDLSNNQLRIEAFARVKKKAKIYQQALPITLQSILPKQKQLIFQTNVGEFIKSEYWQNSVSPFLDKTLKNNSYGDVQATLITPRAEIRTQKARIYTQIKPTNEIKSGALQLFIYSNATHYKENGENADTLFLAIKNMGNETLELKMFDQITIWAASYNQTSMMQLLPTLQKEKDINSFKITPQERTTVFACPLNQLLYTKEHQGAKNYFWQWNSARKNPAISPIVFQDGRLTSGTTLWFEVMIGNKKSSSNILELPVIFASKKKN